jgi:hypothetical protein
MDGGSCLLLWLVLSVLAGPLVGRLLKAGGADEP